MHWLDSRFQYLHAIDIYVIFTVHFWQALFSDLLVVFRSALLHVGDFAFWHVVIATSTTALGLAEQTWGKDHHWTFTVFTSDFYYYGKDPGFGWKR
jgi:hypothetical protein